MGVCGCIIPRPDCPCGNGGGPKYVYKSSEEALRLNRDATPEEKELFLRLQRIIFAGTGFFEEEKDK